MMKKVIFISVLVSVGFVGNVFAAPVTKARNVQPSVKAAQTSVVMPRKVSAERSSTKISSVVPAKVKTSVTPDNGDQERFPIVMNLKGSKVNYKTNSSSTGSSTNNNPAVPAGGVSQDSLDSVIIKVDNLEDKVITSVNSGNSSGYVTDIAKDGNTLNVTKTDSLYVPVKDGNTVVDNVEIWMVR